MCGWVRGELSVREAGDQSGGRGTNTQNGELHVVVVVMYACMCVFMLKGIVQVRHTHVRVFFWGVEGVKEVQCG